MFLVSDLIESCGLLTSKYGIHLTFYWEDSDEIRYFD